MTANQTLSNEAIRHAHYVERYKKYQVRQIQDILEKSKKEIVSKIISYGDSALVSKAKQNALLKEVIDIQNVFNGKITKQMATEAIGFVKSESATVIKQLTGSIPADVRASYGFSEIGPRKLWALVQDRPIMFRDGTTLKIDDIIGKFNVENNNAIRQIINQGYIMGETPQQITKRLTSAGLYEGRQAKAATMVRTVFSHLSSETRNELYRENADIIKGYQWVSTLDSRTTDICADRDGQVWMYDGADPQGAELLPGEVMPPAHYGCRSTTVPITKSYRELGLDMDEVPEGTRSAVDGEVPESQNYFDWLKNQDAKTVQDVLGPTRYEMYKAGEVSITGFYDDGRLMTLKELAEK